MMVSLTKEEKATCRKMRIFLWCCSRTFALVVILEEVLQKAGITIRKAGTRGCHIGGARGIRYCIKWDRYKEIDFHPELAYTSLRDNALWSKLWHIKNTSLNISLILQIIKKSFFLKLMCFCSEVAKVKFLISTFFSFSTVVIWAFVLKYHVAWETSIFLKRTLRGHIMIRKFRRSIQPFEI